MSEPNCDIGADLRNVSDNLYRTIFENSGAASIIVEEDTTISAANQEFAALTGYTKEEIENGMSWAKFFTEDMIEPMQQFHRMRRTDPDKAPRNYQTKLLDRSGSVRHVLMTVALIPDTKSSIGSLIDITDRVVMEEALRERESTFDLFREFGTVFSAIPGILTIISPEMKILWTNRKAQSLTGQQNAETVGENCFEIYHGRTAPCDGCPIVKSFSTGESHYARISSTVGTIWDVKGFPIRNAEGRVISVIDLAEDVTEKIRLEAEALRSAHLASIGELAAGVAHEINNPINGIINYAQILMNRITAESSEHDIASRIVREGHRIADIVKSLLSFARQGQEEKGLVSLGQVLSESLALTSALLRRDGIEVKVNLPDDLPLINVNIQQIKQVFLNLISNAQYALNTKFAGPHPDKRIGIIAEAADGGRSVRIIFRDEGTGMGPKTITKATLPFFTTKPTGKGTGLGLSISHGIISNHGGSLSIESVEGMYTAIIVNLPAAKVRP